MAGAVGGGIAAGEGFHRLFVDEVKRDQAAEFPADVVTLVTRPIGRRLFARGPVRRRGVVLTYD